MAAFKQFNEFARHLIDTDTELSIQASDEAKKTIKMMHWLVNEHVKSKEERREEHEKKLFP